MELQSTHCKRKNMLSQKGRSGLRDYLLEFCDLSEQTRLMSANSVCRNSESVITLRKLLRSAVERLLGHKYSENSLVSQELTGLRRLIINLNIRKEIESIFMKEEVLVTEMRAKGIKSNFDNLLEQEKNKDAQRKVNLYVKFIIRLLTSIILTKNERSKIMYCSYNDEIWCYLFEQASNNFSLIGQDKVFICNGVTNKVNSEFIERLSQVFTDEEILNDFCHYDMEANELVYSSKTKEILATKFPYKKISIHKLEVSIDTDPSESEIAIVKHYLSFFQQMHLCFKNTSILPSTSDNMYILSEEECSAQLFKVVEFKNYSSYFLDLIYEIRLKFLTFTFEDDVNYSDTKLYGILSVIGSINVGIDFCTKPLLFQEKIIESISKNANISKLFISGSGLIRQWDYPLEQVHLGRLSSLCLRNFDEAEMSMILKKLNMQCLNSLSISKCALYCDTLVSIFQIPLREVKFSKINFSGDFEGFNCLKPSHKLQTIQIDDVIFANSKHLKHFFDFLTYNPENLNRLTISFIRSEAEEVQETITEFYMSSLEVILNNIKTDKLSLNIRESNLYNKILYIHDEINKTKIIHVDTGNFNNRFWEFIKNQTNKNVEVTADFNPPHLLDQILSTFNQSQKVEHLKITYSTRLFLHRGEEQKLQFKDTYMSLIQQDCDIFNIFNDMIKLVVMFIDRPTIPSII